MNAASETGALLRRRIAQVSELAPGSIGDMLHFELLDCDPEAGDYWLTCRTEDWMRNPAGTLHGGLGATVPGAIACALALVLVSLATYKKAPTPFLNPYAKQKAE